MKSAESQGLSLATPLGRSPATRYALDADVIIKFQKSRQLAALKAIGRLPILVTDVVWDEVINDPQSQQPRPENRELEEALVAIAGQPTELSPQTPEALTFTKLDAPKFGAGERSVIAYALHHEDVTAVLLDKLALHRAVEELQGQRVLSLHGVLRALEPHGLFRQVALEVSDSFCRANQPHRPPLWW